MKTGLDRTSVEIQAAPEDAARAAAEMSETRRRSPSSTVKKGKTSGRKATVGVRPDRSIFSVADRSASRTSASFAAAAAKNSADWRRSGSAEGSRIRSGSSSTRSNNVSMNASP